MADDDIDDAARVDRADLDAIVADALVIVDQVQSLEPYLPQLAPRIANASTTMSAGRPPTRPCAPTSRTGGCSARGARKAAIARFPRRRRRSPPS